MINLNLDSSAPGQSKRKYKRCPTLQVCIVDITPKTQVYVDVL